MTQSVQALKRSQGNGLDFSENKVLVRADRGRNDTYGGYHGLRVVCAECQYPAIPGDDRCYTHKLG